MLRSILGFVAGYFCLALVVVIGFLIGPLALGVDRVFQPGAYDATPLWQWLALLISMLAGCAGGAVCSSVGRSRAAVHAMVAVVISLGAISGLMQSPRAEPAPVRPAGQPLMELMKNVKEHSREPLFTRITTPLAGAAGVLLGASLLGRRRGRGGESDTQA